MDLKISGINAKQNTNFGQVTMVQLPYQAFESPQNLLACEGVFSKTLKQAVNGRILNKFSILGLSKVKSRLEHYSYSQMLYAMKTNKMEYDISWARQNTRISVEGPVEAGYHSFYVFTGEHKNLNRKAFLWGLKNYWKILSENMFRNPPADGRDPALRTCADFGVQMDRVYDLDGENAPTAIIRLNNLNEIKTIVDKLN